MVCDERNVIAATNGSASKKPSTGYGMRTTVSALAANEPRKVVSTSKKVNSARLATCTKRRAQTSPRITRRAGMPEPGSLGSIFLGRAGPLGGADAMAAEAMAGDATAEDAPVALSTAG